MKFVLVAAVAALALAGCKVDFRDMPNKNDSQISIQ